MRILPFIISISIAISVIHATSLAAVGNNNEQQAVDIHPVPYGGLKKRSSLVKRDYATTLQYLLAAMASYRKNAVTPPSTEFMQLEQSLPPSPPSATEAQPNQQFIAPPLAPEQAPQHLDATLPLPPPSHPSLTPNAPTPKGEAPISPEPPKDKVSATPELGNKSTKKKVPIHADIEEDDTFDPEEDPDDVDDPPIVNGVAANREE